MISNWILFAQISQLSLVRKFNYKIVIVIFRKYDTTNTWSAIRNSMNI